jgi:hypothetical protein
LSRGDDDGDQGPMSRASQLFHEGAPKMDASQLTAQSACLHFGRTGKMAQMRPIRMQSDGMQDGSLGSIVGGGAARSMLSGGRRSVVRGSRDAYRRAWVGRCNGNCWKMTGWGMAIDPCLGMVACSRSAAILGEVDITTGVRLPLMWQPVVDLVKSHWEVPRGYSDGDRAAGVRAGVSASPLWVDPGCFRGPWGRFSHYERFGWAPSRVLTFPMVDVDASSLSSTAIS